MTFEAWLSCRLLATTGSAHSRSEFVVSASLRASAVSLARQAVLIAMALASLSLAHAASALGGQTPAEAGKTSTTFTFRLSEQTHGSYLTLQFWLQPLLTRATLTAPDGETIDLTTRLRRLPDEQTQNPDRGDLYLMTDIVRDPRAGRWQLLLDHAAAGARHSVVWQVVHQPRFAAALSVVGGDSLREGVEVDVLLNLTDYGMASADGLPGSLLLTATDGARSAYPLESKGASGQFEARVPVQGAGTLTLAAEPTWPLASGGEARLGVSRQWAVKASPATSAAYAPTLVMQIDRDAGGCWQHVRLTMPWQADAAGIYVLSVLLGEVRITGSTDVAEPGPIVLKAFLRGSRLEAQGSDLALGLVSGSLREAKTVEVVQAWGRSEVLLRRSRVPMSQPIDAAVICL